MLKNNTQRNPSTFDLFPLASALSTFFPPPPIFQVVASRIGNLSETDMAHSHSRKRALRRSQLPSLPIWSEKAQGFRQAVFFLRGVAPTDIQAASFVWFRLALLPLGCNSREPQKAGQKHHPAHTYIRTNGCGSESRCPKWNPGKWKHGPRPA